MYLCVPGTSGRMAGEPPVTRAAFLRSFGSIVYFPIVGSAFSLPLKLYGEMDSLARRVWLILQLGASLTTELMVICLKGQSAYSLCHHGMLHVSSLSGRDLFKLDFFFTRHLLFTTHPCQLAFVFWFREWICMKQEPSYQFFIRFYLFIFREGKGGKKRERNINVWLPLERPLLGTWPTTQTCALTGNPTSDSLVCRPALNPLSHISQGSYQFF